MNKDIRVDLGFFTHRKTRRLIARFGLESAWGLLRLWAFAAKSRPSGFLSGMDAFDIVAEMHLDGVKVDPEELLKFMSSPECRWIDMAIEGIHLHNWRKHNPWVAGSEDRSDIARFSRLSKLYPKIYKDLLGMGVKAISRDDYDKLTKPQRLVNESLTKYNESLTNGPTNGSEKLTPDPDPDPKSKDAGKPKKDKPAPNPEIRVVIDYFFNQYKSKFGAEPLIGKKDVFLVSSRLKKFTVDGLKDAIDFFLVSDKVKEYPTLAVAMSDHSLNLFEQKCPAKL